MVPKWLLAVTPTKSAVMAFRSLRKPRAQLKIIASAAIIPQQQVHCHLSIVFNQTLTWSDHVDKVISSASVKLGLLRRMNKQLDSRRFETCALGQDSHLMRVGCSASVCVRDEVARAK